MIINRLATATRDQNWLTLALEVLVVVVGIFLGLQADAWNQSRIDRATEVADLQRLQEDTVFNVAQVTVKARSYIDRADSLTRIVGHLEAGTVDEIDDSDLTSTFCYWYVPEAIRMQSATYDEMTSTGRLELISDSGLLQKLQLAWAEHNLARDNIRQLAPVHTRLAESIKQFAHWRFGAPIQQIDQLDRGGIDVDAGCVVDRAAMSVDADLASILVQLNRGQSILANLHLGEQYAFEDLLTELDRTE